MLTNPVKAKLAEGRAVIGVFVGSTDPRFVELCGRAGFDYVLLDSEHYPFTLGEIENMVRAGEVMGIPTFVRVAANRPELIRQTLDVGVWGVMVPRIYDAADAKAAVEAAKYGPLGTRGAQTGRAASVAGAKGFADWSRISNDESMVIIQIETREAVENLGAILEVPGIDAFELGRLDLAQSLGIPGGMDDPRVAEYNDRAVDQILSSGRVLGDTTDDPEEVAAFLGRGYRMVACHLDRVALTATSAFVAAARAAALS